jgi:hypothetical protein
MKQVMGATVTRFLRPVTYRRDSAAPAGNTMHRCLLPRAADNAVFRSAAKDQSQLSPLRRVDPQNIQAELPVLEQDNAVSTADGNHLRADLGLLGLPLIASGPPLTAYLVVDLASTEIFDLTPRAWCLRQTTVCGHQGRLNRLSQGHICRVVRRDVSMQLPYPHQ